MPVALRAICSFALHGSTDACRSMENCSMTASRVMISD
jgi:hypothetical protein